MSKQAKITAVVLAVSILGALSMLLYKNNDNTNNQVGNDRDEHGCIASAGYTWNHDREQCIRPWELATMMEAEEAVKLQLAQKYQKQVSDIFVTVTKIDEGHVAGSIKFSSDASAAGGQFLALREKEAWKIVYEGNGAVDCTTLRETYGFSNLVLVPQFCD